MFDFARAYDRVWRAGLLAKLGRLGVPGCVCRWIRALLTDRRARVRWGATLSNSRVFQEGLPRAASWHHCYGWCTPMTLTTAWKQGRHFVFF